MRVFVYFNLHRKLFSVRAMEGPDKGRVILHTDTLLMRDVTFKVSEAGRQRVLREQRKNVHAGMVGTVAATADAPGVRVTYNPYKHDTFVVQDTQAPVHTCKSATLSVGARVPFVYAAGVA